MTTTRHRQPGSHDASRAFPGTAPRSRRPEGVAAPTVSCFLTTLHPERALSRALVQHLHEELPEVLFHLRPADRGVDVVWLCGYESGASGTVANLRRCFPHARFLVTGRAPLDTWAAEASDAGADTVREWPLPLERLREVLLGA